MTHLQPRNQKSVCGSSVPRTLHVRTIENYPPAIEALNAQQEVDEVPIPLEDESMDDAALRDVPISSSTR